MSLNNSSYVGKTKHLVADTKLLSFWQVLYWVRELFLEGQPLQKKKNLQKRSELLYFCRIF